MTEPTKPTQSPEPCADDAPCQTPPDSPLTSLKPGDAARILGSTCEKCDAVRLHAMGLRPNVRVTLKRLGEPCIVEIASGPGVSHRIGLNKPLADRLMVEPIADKA